MLTDHSSNDTTRGSGKAETQSAQGQDLVRRAELRYNRGRSVRRLGELL